MFFQGLLLSHFNYFYCYEFSFFNTHAYTYQAFCVQLYSSTMPPFPPFVRIEKRFVSVDLPNAIASLVGHIYMSCLFVVTIMVMALLNMVYVHSLPCGRIIWSWVHRLPACH